MLAVGDTVHLGSGVQLLAELAFVVEDGVAPEEVLETHAFLLDGVVAFEEGYPYC